MSVHGGPNTIEDGLVLYLDAANPKSYPGSGTTWTDLKEGRQGTINNSPAFNGNYFSFDGVNENVTFAAPIEVQTAGFTMGFLMKVPETQINGVNWCFMLADRDFGAGDYEIGIYGINSTSFIFKENASVPNSATAFLGTNWNYLVFGMNTNLTPFIYINGVLRTQLETSFVSSTLDFTHLFSSLGNTNYFKCDCSYISLYNRALTSSEIQQNFNAIRGRFNI
jgi:hypothetical protein